MSRNTALLDLMEETTTALERAANALERVASEFPADVKELSLPEAFVVSSHIGRMQIAHVRLATATTLFKARTGAKEKS